MKTFKQQAARVMELRSPSESITVERGDTLWSLAERRYGDGRYFEILKRANPRASRRILRSGDVIKTPAFATILADKSLVHEGDTLWGIAAKRLGDGRRYPELMWRNPQITDPTRLLPLHRIDPQR